MAESWSLSEDKLTYTIKLREGILWHDFVDPVSGEEWKDVPVTAEDFKFYIDVIKNPDVDCAPLRVYFQDLDRIEVVNDLEFRVVWSKKYFKSESITLGLSPLPRHFYHAYEGPFDGKRFNDDHERNRIVVGCGPYQFQRWDKFQRIVLERWEKYYGRRYGVMPPIKHRVIEIIKHPNTQFQALLAGKIDSMGLQPDQWVNKTNTPEFDPVTGSIRKIKTMGHAYFYIGYNLNNPLFQDRTVRRALTHLVNRERIASEVFFDLAVVTSGPFFIESPYYDSSVEPYPFSIEKGRELFADAGWRDTDGDGILDKDGKKFEFTILAVAGHPTQSKMLPIIKEDMEKAGVVMRIANVEWPVYTQRLETKSFEVCTLGWTSDLEPDPYQLWHSSQAEIPSSSNHIGFKNPEADRLIEEIRVCFDLQERIRLCHEFHRLLHEEQPYTFLFSRNSLLALSARYRNVREFPLGVEPKTFWTPTEAQKRIEF
jgi:peptide/nickel transport system substrate-binding protein